MVTRAASVLLEPGQLPGPVNKTIQDQMNAIGTDLTTAEGRATALENFVKAVPNSASFSIGGTVSDASRDVTVTFKGWSNTALAVEHKVSVWLTTYSSGDTGDVGAKGTAFDTLAVKSGGGKQLSTTLAGTANGYIEALTKTDGTLVITVAKTTNNVKNYLHVSHMLGQAASTVIELNKP